ncbi:MAG: aldo/keto reductase, partial [Acidimicrobiales bacterium]
DGRTPMAETMGALAELVAEGKVREIGCSNVDAAHINEAEAIAGDRGIPRFHTVQNHYSLLTRDPETDGVLDACERYGVGFVPFFPLESGVLTGKYTFGEAAPEGTRLASMGDRAERFLNDERAPRITAMNEWAEDAGHTLLEAAIAWLIADERVTSVISGATKPEQVAANAAAATWVMSAAERAELSAL